MVGVDKTTTGTTAVPWLFARGRRIATVVGHLGSPDPHSAGAFVSDESVHLHHGGGQAQR
jgi:hypothetical protein